eukprot:XP_001692595.1 predicted protein [Chlamydomonas reinhardtii]
MVVSAAWRRPTGGGRCRLLAAVLLGAVVVMAAHGGPLGASAQEEKLGGTDAAVQFGAAPPSPAPPSPSYPPSPAPPSPSYPPSPAPPSPSYPPSPAPPSPSYPPSPAPPSPSYPPSPAPPSPAAHRPGAAHLLPVSAERKPCFKVFAWRKTLLYVQSEDRFTYNEAQEFCSDRGVFMVGYDDPVKRLPLADLCYKNGNGCWVGGQVGDTCPYIDPKGNGASYPEKCERRHYAVCWGDLDKQRNNPAIWDNNCPKNNKSQDSKKRDKNYD